MRSRSALSRPFLLVVLAAAALSTCVAACAGQTASYTRFRRAADHGRMVASHEVRVQDFVNRFAQEDASPAAITSADATALYVDARVANPHLPREGGTALLGVTLRGVPRTVRTPAELIVVVDVSGSMNEAGKITAVRHALARMVETLDPADHIALVAFSDSAHVALPMTSVGAARPVVLAAVASLYADGGTNLGAGLQTAMSLVRSSRPTNTRILLLSDGIATVGETNPDSLVRSVSPLRLAHVPITTVGVGDAIDFALLEALGSEQGGAFHYVDQPAEVERVFATYVRAISEVSARSVELLVTAPPGGRIVRAFDERARVDGASARAEVGDFGASDAHVALFEVELPPGTLPSEIPVEVRFRTLDGAEQYALQRGAPYGHDGTGAYSPVDEREPGLLRAAAMGYAAMGLRAAALSDEQGDARGARVWLDATRTTLEAARSRLSGADPARAATLAEPLSLVQRAHDDVAARVPPDPVAANTVTYGAAPSAPIVTVGGGAQLITTAPGVTIVPTTVAVGASPQPAPASAPGSAVFAGWR